MSLRKTLIQKEKNCESVSLNSFKFHSTPSQAAGAAVSVARRLWVFWRVCHAVRKLRFEENADKLSKRTDLGHG